MILWLIGYIVACCLATFASTSAVADGLTLYERLVIGLAATFTIGSALAYVLALGFGLGPPVVVAGPLLLAGIAYLAGFLRGDPIQGWRQSAARLRTSAAERKRAIGLSAVIVVATVIAVPLYGHIIYETADGLAAGYANVWSDWSLHLGIANSFFRSANFPAADPLFAGTPLRYPFLPDFQGSMLMTLGVPATLALVVPSAILFVVAVAALSTLALRLQAGLVAGLVVALICILGGGVGFVGLFGDACHAHGFTQTQCEFSSAWHDPGVIGGTLAQLPTTITHQSRAYDGDFASGNQLVFPDQQWYTPLFAWWLPQRTFLYGFVSAIAVLTLLFCGQEQRRHKAWPEFVLAGFFCGILPLVQVQTAIVLAIVLATYFFMKPRWEWFGLGGVAALVGGWRAYQLVTAPHGSLQYGNAYPWLKAGWLAAPSGTPPPSNLPAAVGDFFLALFHSRFWLFWLHNGIVAVGLSVAFTGLLWLRLLPWPVGKAWAARGVNLLGRSLLRFAIPFLLVFVLCNLVVFQPWDWDNTKLLLYWQLAAAFLLAAVVVRLRPWWSRAAGGLAVLLTIATGLLGVIRVSPLTPKEFSFANAAMIATKSDEQLVNTLVQRTAPHAVFLTSGNPNDPIVTLAGRPSLLAYYGWLWSYGDVFGSRIDDAKAIFAGCENGDSLCAQRLQQMVTKYHIAYVEADANSDSYLGPANPDWWNSRHYPVVAMSQSITVFDVRGGPIANY